MASLEECFRSEPRMDRTWQVLIFDNSEGRQPAGNVQLPCQFHHRFNGRNLGVAAAYNAALELAVNAKIDWLLLLDQDSLLPKDFGSKLNSAINQVQEDARVCAIAPRVFCRGRQVSPTSIRFCHTMRPVENPAEGVYEGPVNGIGSGLAVRVSFLRGIGGFDPEFWLDFLDHWLFEMIAKGGKKVFLTSTRLQHELSIVDYDAYMTPSRYSNILKYESIFFKRCKSKSENAAYPLKLILRAIKQFFIVRNKRYSKMTLCQSWRALRWHLW